MTTADRRLAKSLAQVFLAGDWDRRGMHARGVLVLGRRRGWLGKLVDELLTAYPRQPADRPRELTDHIQLSPHFLPSVGTTSSGPRVHPPQALLVVPTRMIRRPHPVVRLDDQAALAGLLDLPLPMLDWFADLRDMQRRAPAGALHHYRYHWVPTRGGGSRLLEAPRPRLRALQRRVLEATLAPIPVHTAAYGFVAGRSAVDGAAWHVGASVVLTLDLRSFFASITAPRVAGVFRAAGYPEPVADLLAGLCTHATPAMALTAMPGDGVAAAQQQRFQLQRFLSRRHLPQGAPTSPQIANLCAFVLDRRLQAYADALGATYTRYADDLTFSGDHELRHRASALIKAVAGIVREEGFTLNPSKTRVQGRGRRQSVTGIVVNDRTNMARPDYDMLKAILHNCAERGPETQNRTGHSDFRGYLLGRIGWVTELNPGHGHRLRADFDRIAWPD
jgi:RNA-directed DNA polymerase